MAAKIGTATCNKESISVRLDAGSNSIWLCDEYRNYVAIYSREQWEELKSYVEIAFGKIRDYSLPINKIKQEAYHYFICPICHSKIRWYTSTEPRVGDQIRCIGCNHKFIVEEKNESNAEESTLT